MNQDIGLIGPEAKREMAQRVLDEHGETINAYPDLRWEFGVLYRDMDDLPMRQFRAASSASRGSVGISSGVDRRGRAGIGAAA